MKTVFIILTRGMMVRNILRSGTLAILQKKYRVILFFPENEKTAFPEYLREELTSESTLIEIVLRVNHSRIYRLFCALTKYLTPSASFFVYLRIGNVRNLAQPAWKQFLKGKFFALIGSIHWLKKLVRYVETRCFTTHEYAHYFETYQPSVVFGTSIVSSIDIDFMKEARSRGIATLGMTKGWDLTTKMLYRFVPDRIAVLNEPMKQSIIDVQKIDGDRIDITGFPQFDAYTNPSLVIDRSTFLTSLGLDPKRKVIFFGSEGVWAPNDPNIAETLAMWINTPGMLPYDCSLIIRPHYTDIKNQTFEFLRAQPNVYVDDKLNRVDFFLDNWDPRQDEVIHLANILKWSDMLVTVASTLTLDMVCFDKPIINVAYNALLHQGADVTVRLYEMDHYQWVLNTQGVSLVYSDQELLTAINQYFADPTIKHGEREVLRASLCYRVDGQSSLRLANAIESMIK